MKGGFSLILEILRKFKTQTGVVKISKEFQSPLLKDLWLDGIGGAYKKTHEIEKNVNRQLHSISFCKQNIIAKFLCCVCNYI